MFKTAFVLFATLPLTAMATPVVEGVYVSGTVIPPLNKNT